MQRPVTEITTTQETRSSTKLATIRVWKFRTVYEGGAVAQATAQGCVGSEPLTIGRQVGTEARVGAWMGVLDARVSRAHVRVVLDGEVATLCDVGSKNGTRVNGHRVAPNVRVVLGDGDVIELGDSILVARHERLLLDDGDVAEVIGVSAAAQDLRHRVVQAAQHARSVLLLGETGTGKGLLAEAIHRHSKRPGRLVHVNCAAIPPALAESLFFGVQRGAFTGAVEGIGYFGEADQGTLFLDEVGELPPVLQAKLLVVLETGQITPLGSTRPTLRDVRVIAATHRALLAERFRKDLYARLSATIVEVPPLRGRREDILPLVRHVMGTSVSISPRLAAELLLHTWPHNVRELNQIGQLLLDGHEADARKRLQALSEASGAAPTGVAQPPIPAVETPPRRPAARLVKPTREALHRLLSTHQGNLHQIEWASGYPRYQLRRWAKGFGIDVDSYRCPRENAEGLSSDAPEGTTPKRTLHGTSSV